MLNLHILVNGMRLSSRKCIMFNWWKDFSNAHHVMPSAQVEQARALLEMILENEMR
jgi:hypothetical protein